jgi:hypothetical protein
MIKFFGKITQMMVIGLVTALLLCSVTIAESQQSKSEGRRQGEGEEPIIILTKEVSGKVSAITPHLIVIVYKEDKEKHAEYEIDIPIGKDVTLAHTKTLNAIGIGDTVYVTYEERQKEYEAIGKDGTVKLMTKVIGREAKIITFIKPKITGLRSGE